MTACRARDTITRRRRNFTWAVARIALAISLPSIPARADDAGLWRSWPGPALDWHSMVVDSLDDRALIVGGGSSTGMSHIVWSRDLTNGDSWTPLPTTTPGPTLRRAAAVMDSRRNRVLVIGGDSASTAGEVHVLDLSPPAQWSLLATTGVGPAPGPIHGAWIDDSLGTVICADRAGLWRLTLEGTPTWSSMAAGTGPPNVVSPARALDSRRHRMLAQGGNTPNWSRMSGSLLNGLWELSLLTGDTATWRPIDGLGLPYRSGHAAFYDITRDRLVAVGGQAGWLLLAHDSWSASLDAPANVQTLTSTIHPNGLLAYDRGHDRLLDHVFSSFALHTLPLNGAIAWTTEDRTGVPGISGPTVEAVYDPRRNRMLVFGGAQPYSPANEVRSLALDDLPRWDVIATVGTPPNPRSGASVAFDVLRDRLIVHGGYAPGMSFNETRALSFATTPPSWSVVRSPGPYTQDAPALYDPVRDALLLFTLPQPGGLCIVQQLPLGGPGGWSEMTTSGVRPRALIEGHVSSAYDPLRERWLLFGYADGAMEPVCALDLATRQWTVLPEMGLPEDSYHHYEAVFDLLSDRLVAYGGTRDIIDPPGPPYVREVPTWVRAMSFAETPVVTTLGSVGPSPKGRENAWMVLDPVRDALVMSTGFSLTEETPQDTWSLDWARLSLRLIEASADTEAVRLQWRSVQLARRTLELHRRAPSGVWAKLADVDFDAAGDMAFRDTSAHGPARFGYRLLDTSRWQPVLSEIWMRGAGGSDPPIVPSTLSLRAAPNPAIGGAINLRLLLDASGAPDIALVDLNGRVVMRWTLQSFAAGEWNVPLSLPPGIGPGLYWLRANLPGRTASARVAVLR